MPVLSFGLRSGRHLLNSLSCHQSQSRSIYWLLYAAGNKIDDDRVRQIGPDKACAEWLVKCGAAVRFHGAASLVRDYNLLGSSSGRSSKLAEVLAEEATIMNIGFPHFKDVKQVEKLSFKKCARFDNSCISQIAEYLSDSVRELEIVSCGDVTGSGLESIGRLKKLENLRLFELPAVKNKTESFQHLVQKLPGCKITFEDQDFSMSHP